VPTRWNDIPFKLKTKYTSRLASAECTVVPGTFKNNYTDVARIANIHFTLLMDGSAYLVPAYPGCPGKEAIKWV